MKTVHDQIVEMAAIFDREGRPQQPIQVRVSRKYLMEIFKPRKRGGPLFHGEHELVPAAAENFQSPEQAVIG